MQRKLAMEISSVKTLELIQNGHWNFHSLTTVLLRSPITQMIFFNQGNFQVQNLRKVIQTTMEISKGNISMQLIENDGGNFQRKNFGWYKWRRKFQKAECGVDPKWPLKFPTSKLLLMQNDAWNFQRKHFESSKWPCKFATSKLWVIQDDHGNF